MDPITIMSLLGGGAGLLGTLFGGKKTPEYGFGQDEIDKLISGYRQQGLAGLQSLGQQQEMGATRRMASMGMAPSPALMQSVRMPIMERLAGGRAQLEGGLAGAEGGMQQHAADVQYGGEMERYRNLQELFASLMDIGGMGLLKGGEGIDWGFDLSNLFGGGGGRGRAPRLAAGTPTVNLRGLF